MKRFRLVGKILSAAIIAALLVLSTVTPALAAPNLSISPSSGKVGRTVYLYGSSYTAGLSVYVYFSSDAAKVNDRIDEDVTAYELVATTSVSSGSSTSGTFDTDFVIPSRLSDGDDTENVRNGDYYVYTTYSGSSIIRAAADFEVTGTSEITLSPKTVIVDKDMKVTGMNFGNEEAFTIKYDGKELSVVSGDTITSKSGSFSCTVSTPAAPAGIHTLTVTGTKSKVQASADFIIEPRITLSPQSGAAGDSITVTGTGFGDRTDLNIFFGDFRVLTGKVSDRYGNFSLSFEALPAGAGRHTVEVVDGLGNSGKETYTIGTTTATLNPNSGYPDAEINISGIGFAASEMVTIKFANTQVRTTATDAAGRFSDIFIVPRHPGGNYDVTITDGTNTVTAPFTITASISLSQTTGAIGSDLTLSGSGFSGVITIKYDDTVIATTTPNANGMFAVTFKVPSSIHGKHDITATGAINIIRTDFYVESASPQAPAPLFPIATGREHPQTVFQWGTVTDPSGVSYELQVATDANFAGVIVEKKNLTLPQYTLSQMEKLPATGKNAPFYWRVRAIDGAQNAGEWTEPRSFYISVFPDWAKYLLIVIGALAVAAAIFWAGMKTALMKADKE